MGKTFKDIKKTGKHVFDGPKVKDRKKFAPATKTEKSKKGKGSFERIKSFDEDEEKKVIKKVTKKGGKSITNHIKESILKFVEATLDNNYSKANEYLKDVVEKKIQIRIEKEINTSLFAK